MRPGQILVTNAVSGGENGDCKNNIKVIDVKTRVLADVTRRAGGDVD